jgi:hypothetical protein
MDPTTVKILANERTIYIRVEVIDKNGALESGSGTVA